MADGLRQYHYLDILPKTDEHGVMWVLNGEWLMDGVATLDQAKAKAAAKANVPVEQIKFLDPWE